MNTIFIVRPFGNQRPVMKKNKEGIPEIVFFDFDRVENDLVIPAMHAAGLQGGTTQRIFEAGEIKEDMFSGLLLADIVIADITIHNANVFYELGIRHALRKKTTILIKCDGFDDTPFDIIGFKYLTYQKENPGAALADLIKFITGSLGTEKKDSPVFNMLPKLQEQETESFFAIPAGFTEEVMLAAAGKRLGKLSLLAAEAGFFPWKTPALRLIGEALFKLGAFYADCIIWENIKAENANDIQANDRLATVYQRLAEIEMSDNPSQGLELLTRSDLAIESLLNNSGSPDSIKRAEAFSLKGRNAKTKWINSWKNAASGQKGITALQSIFLEAAFKNYESGYFENLNHFYSGINALGLLITMTALAEQYAAAWMAPFASDEEANQRLKQLKEKQQKLAVSVEFSLVAERKRLETQGKTDSWLAITEADFICLTASRSSRVAVTYKKALENAQDLHIDAATKQLKIYQPLTILDDTVQAALSAIPPAEAVTGTKKHFLLFAGHMIDKPDRKEPRFPALKEAGVRQCIKEKIIEEKNKLVEGIFLTGIAGGACGGDILFHEVCAELGIATQIYLAFPADQFVTESVAFGGNNWTKRFDKLFNTLPHQVLAENKHLPGWLQKKEGYDIWARNNLWLLNSALINGTMNMSFLALWDGKTGDGPGGTEHLITEAETRGVIVTKLDIHEIPAPV
jgi:hypothetical protein